MKIGGEMRADSFERSDAPSGRRNQSLIAINSSLVISLMLIPAKTLRSAHPDDLSTNQAPLTQTARLPRENLLVYRGANGELLPVITTDDWSKRRAEIVAGMQAVMGKLPGDERRCPLAMQVENEVDRGTYVRRLITYGSEPDCRTPAYLLIPKAALRSETKRVPAVLCLHSTDNLVGHGNVVGLGAKTHRAFANELAERGYVVLAPSYPLLAKYQPNLKALGWESGTLKAVWDNIRGLDLLESLPFVSPGTFGAVGHSLGGHNAVFTAVLDDRIKAVVSSCGLDSFVDYSGGDEKLWMPETGWTQTRLHAPPGCLSRPTSGNPLRFP